MRKLSRLIFFGLLALGLCASLLASLPAAPRVAAAVTLLSFTATTQDGDPTVHLRWETATERNTAGFYVQRSSDPAGPWTAISAFIRAEGTSISGIIYPTDGPLADTTTELNQTYYYQLIEVQTNQATQQVGDTLAVTAGLEKTPAPTATATATPTTLPGSGQATATSTSTSTPTPTPNATSNSRAVSSGRTSPGGASGTPSILSGVTITPMPSSVRLTDNPQPNASQPNITPAAAQPPSAPFAPTPPAVAMANAAAASGAPPAQSASGQAIPVAAPTQPPQGTVGTHALVEPVVIDAAAPQPDSLASQLSTSPIMLLLLAAILMLLGGGFLITRHTRS